MVLLVLLVLIFFSFSPNPKNIFLCSSFSFPSLLLSTSSPQPLDDPYGHAVGCAGGVTCSLALSAASGGKDRVELVSVPRSGSSGRATLEILKAYEVHRQLTLSPRFSQVLGVDDVTDSTSIHYMYDYARGITTRELLEIGGPLRTSSPLFRYVVSEMLESFIEFEERCTFGLRGKVGTHHVMIAEAGTSVRLCRLPLGDELSSFSTGHDVSLFHARRESELVHSFGTMVTEMLQGPVGDAGHAPPVRRGESSGVEDGAAAGSQVYDQEVARAGVNVTPGETFTLLLDADTSKGYVWDTPVMLNDDRSTVPIVSYQGMDPRGGSSSSSGGSGGGASSTTFAVRFRAVQTGSCTLSLTRKRPWDTTVTNEMALIIKVAVHERGMDPSYAAVLRACTEGQRTRLDELEGTRRVVTERSKLREPWQRQPTLRELRRHPLLSCSAARDTPEVDQLITAFERHVDYD